MKTADYSVATIAPHELADLQAIANLPLTNIRLDDSAPLLVFPDSFREYDSAFGNKAICNISTDGTTLATNSLVGFVGRGNTRLTIHSRFAKGNTDYFLHYMLQQVVGINLFNLQHDTDLDALFDFLAYLFPAFLKRALRQGVYKEYVTLHHNDANIKGCLDVSRHMRSNIPFAGKIAYNTRRYCYDNHITQLIRHTAEYIKKTPIGSAILNSDIEVAEYLRVIADCTPSYTAAARQAVINSNVRPMSHPYFSEYQNLQRLCMRILRHDELKYGNDSDEIYGILIDAAWLWEEYLGKILSPKFRHYKKDRGPRFYLFDNFQQIIPDYLSADRRIVADAKYIPLDRQRYYGDEKATAIYYKTITYMYRFCAGCAYLLYPHPDAENAPEHYNIKTETPGVNGGTIIKHGLRIPAPDRCKDYSEFCSLIAIYEAQFLAEL